MHTHLVGFTMSRFILFHFNNSETCPKQLLKNIQNRFQVLSGSFEQAKNNAENSTGSFCITFDLH